MSFSCILVVDDDDDVRTSLQMVLEIEGYEIVTAGNGVEALALLRALPKLPDLVILDLMMPVMNGYEFVQQVRSDELLQELPILVATAGTLQEPLLGVEGMLPKPVQLDDLLKSCRALIAGQTAAIKF
jgi:two-component system sensor histidine kinase/response regulator